MTDSAQRKRMRRASTPAIESGGPNETLSEFLRKTLESAIASGELAAGTRLDEKETAERYGVSRTPVREAFRALATANLVELRGRQGVIVRSIDIRTLVEMFQVMAELEGLCARLAARRLTPEAERDLKDRHEYLLRVAEQGDIAVFYEANEAFHEVVYEASQNRYLASQTRSLRNQISVYRRRATYASDRIKTTIREHKEILDAILSHDGERAQQLSRDHVNLLGEDLVDLLAAYA